MRSSQPIPGNPWPHDMVIRINIDDGKLCHLLFVRSAWGLHPPGLPDLDSEPDPGASARPRRPAIDELERLWLLDWSLAWSRFESPRQVPPPDRTLRDIDAATDQELREWFSPRISERWYQGIDHNAENTWRISLVDSISPLPGEDPEWRSLPALINAWETGLRTIVQLPFQGYYAQPVNPTHLLVSRLTRQEPELYSQALNHFFETGRK